MTSKERVLAVLYGKPVDKIPVHHIQFSGQVAAAILGRKALVGGVFVQWHEMQALWQGEDAWREFDAQCKADAVDIAKACRHDLLRLGYWRWPKAQKPVKKVDEHTFLFGDPDGRWFTMTYLPDVELFVRREGTGTKETTGTPGAAEPEITEEVLLKMARDEEAKADALPKASGLDPKFKALYETFPDYLLKVGTDSVFIDVGSEQHLMASALWPELYARMLAAQARQIAGRIPALAAAGMQANFAGMDFCGNSGPMVSPSSWRSVVMPAVKQIADACHRHGIKYFYSSDGNFWPVADDFFKDAGVDGWYEVDKSAGMDLRKLRTRYPKATFIGNIRVQLLQNGTVEDVKREVLETLEAAHELGGIIAGTSNMIMPGTPPRNIETLLKTIEDNR